MIRYRYLIFSIAGVPQRVSHHLSGTGVGFDQFQLNTGLGNGSEGCGLPVGLRVLLPHDCVEMGIVLVTENETDIVVVDFGVDEESAFEIDATESMETDGQTGIAVHRLDNFGSFIVNDPIGIDL